MDKSKEGEVVLFVGDFERGYNRMLSCWLIYTSLFYWVQAKMVVKGYGSNAGRGKKEFVV